MKKIRFNAKTIPDTIETKVKVESGYKNYEMQLIHEYVSEKEYSETDKIIDELGCDISVVHTPLIVGTCNELTLDELLKEKFYSYFVDACKYAEYIAKKENKRIKVVIHDAFAKYIWEETNLIEEKVGPLVKDVLDKNPDIDLVIENSIFYERDLHILTTIYDLSDVAYTVKELNKIVPNRVFTLIDTCHNMMNALGWKKLTEENILDWDDTFKKATTYNKLGLIHLNNMWVNGMGKDHGVGFLQSHDGDIEKLTKIMQAYEKYADCEITIEVREDDYLQPPRNLIETEKSLNSIGFEKA